jgi:hypothetical protein
MKYNNQFAAVTALFFIIACILTEKSYAQQFTYTGGASISSGSYYFQESTRSFYLTNGLMVSHKNFSISASVPYIVQNTPWLSYSRAGGLPTGGTQSGEVRRIGMGGNSGGSHGSHGHRRIALTDTTSYTRASFSDPSILTGYRIWSNRTARTSVFVNSQVKIPFSGPSSGYGTGAWDAGAGLSASVAVFTSWMMYANLMYWHLGDMDELELNNTLAYGAGIGRFSSDRKWMTSVNITGFTKILDTYDPPLSAAIGAGYISGSRTILNSSLSLGLTESSPDFSFGLGWAITF